MEDLGSIPGSGRSPGDGNGNPFQLFVVYLKFKFDRGVMYLWASKVAWVVKNGLPMQKTGDAGWIPELGRSPWRRAWQLTLVFLPGASYGHRSLVGYVHWFAKSWTRLKWLSKHVFIFAKSGNPELAGKSKILWLCRITVIESTGAWGQRIRSHGESAMDLRESLVGHCRKPKVHVEVFMKSTFSCTNVDSRYQSKEYPRLQ